MSGGQGLQVGFVNNDHVELVSELLVPQLSLVDIRLDVIFRAGLLKQLGWQVVVIDLGAVFWVFPSLWFGTRVGQIQACIVAQLRNQVKSGLPNHPGTGIVAKMTIHDQIFERDQAANQRQQCG